MAFNAKVEFALDFDLYTVPNDSYHFWADLHLEGHV